MTMGSLLVAETHRPKELLGNNTVHGQVMRAFVCTNRRARPRPHDSVDLAVVVTCSGQSKPLDWTTKEPLSVGPW